MRSRVRCSVSIALAAVLIASISWAAPNATTAPTTNTHKAASDAKAAALARKKAKIALDQAIHALAKEFEAHNADETVPLREKSDYFEENPSPEITSDAIFSALNSSGGPTAEACYIKWQLLSALPPKATDQTAPLIGELYDRAPGPLPNPSLNSGDKAQLDAQLQRRTADDENTINDAWTKRLGEWVAMNVPILAYSEGLYSMLPHGVGAATLGLQDAFQRRAAAGVDCDLFINNIISDTRDWAVSAPPDQLRLVAQQFSRWSKMIGPTFPPQIYLSVKWNDQSNQLRWMPGQMRYVPPQPLDDFRKFLLDQANSPSGGIKIKTDG